MREGREGLGLGDRGCSDDAQPTAVVACCEKMVLLSVPAGHRSGVLPEDGGSTCFGYTSGTNVGSTFDWGPVQIKELVG